jgi:phage portal protein BeeE
MRDAEFLGGKESAKRDICEALGVPNQLIGLEGSQTFANYEQARAAFYEDAAIPLFESFLSSLNKWLGWRVGLKPSDMILIDVDAVTALEPRRSERNKTVDTLQSISTNEKRAAMGYPDVVGGDDILVNSGLIPLEMAGADIPTMGNTL